MTVSRARGKLEAAIERFGLAAAVRGARAVDVGASTGGFTESLLAHGAAHVTAIDVGHGQLHPSLAKDVRVTSLEKVDFRRMPLDVAEGPFDFFSVDVSFVAARNMLRALAFRLRAGAQGVVLVKPQFELPERELAKTSAGDPAVRRAAVDKVAARAHALGFELVTHADSPVAGASGTIEVLAHLRFVGRPGTLPAKGERRGQKPKPGRAPATTPRTLRWFAVVAPGLERVAAREVAALAEAADVESVPGGVEWTGPLASGVRANLWLRISTRVLARIGTVEAREFGKLRRRAAKLPWDHFVPTGAKVTVQAVAHRCRLYHTGALAENLLLAIDDAVPGVTAAKRDEADLTIQVRGEDDVFTFSVDASGERLHRRGARVETGPAPLRETLAAGLLALAGWTPETPVVDPMCGAGTIVIEAAAQALDRAPGLDRSFALEDWPMAAGAADTIAALRAEAKGRAAASAVDTGATVAAQAVPISASDRDPRAIESARRNAARGGVAARITFTCRDAADARPTTPSGLVIANPPYGRRLADPRAAARVIRDLGRTLRAHFRGWRAGVVVPARLEPARALGLPIAQRFSLRNGGFPITFAVFDVQ